MRCLSFGRLSPASSAWVHGHPADCRTFSPQEVPGTHWPTSCLWLCLFLIHGHTRNLGGFCLTSEVCLGAVSLQVSFYKCKFHPPNIDLNFFFFPLPWNLLEYRAASNLVFRMGLKCSFLVKSGRSSRFFSFSARISFHTWASSSGSQHQLSRLWGWAL